MHTTPTWTHDSSVPRCPSWLCWETRAEFPLLGMVEMGLAWEFEYSVSSACRCVSWGKLPNLSVKNTYQVHVKTDGGAQAGRKNCRRKAFVCVGSTCLSALSLCWGYTC